MNIGGVTNAFVLLIAARVNCLQSTAEAAAAASVIIYPACGLSLPPLQQNKGIAENAGQANNVCARCDLFLSEIVTIFAANAHGSPLAPGALARVECGMEDGIIRTFTVLVRSSSSVCSRERTPASSLRPIWKKRTVPPPKTIGLASNILQAFSMYLTNRVDRAGSGEYSSEACLKDTSPAAPPYESSLKTPNTLPLHLSSNRLHFFSSTAGVAMLVECRGGLPSFHFQHNGVFTRRHSRETRHDAIL